MMLKMMTNCKMFYWYMSYPLSQGKSKNGLLSKKERDGEK